MPMLAQNPSKSGLSGAASFRSRRRTKRRFALSVVVVALSGGGAVAEDVMPAKALPDSANAPAAYDWTGSYLGGHIGYGWGRSSWSTPGASGTLDLTHPIDTFNESGSFFAGLQAGYRYMLPNRVVLGGEIDASFPAWPDLAGFAIGGRSTLPASRVGPLSYSENVLTFGTVRARIGYAPGNWLFYATGGLAWTYDQLRLTQSATGITETPLLWRFGWIAGAGVEVPMAPRWTAKLEYLFTGYRNSSVNFPAAGQAFAADFALQELRVGFNYQFDNGGAPANFIAPGWPDQDRVNFHAQMTLTEQANAPFRSPYIGANSLPGIAEGRETFDATLYAGVRLWHGAEFWADLELDQGFGLGNTHGTAGFASGEAYKLGASYPYARVQRYFVRQTIDLGGESRKIDADINQFAGAPTDSRLVLTVGKFAAVDIFDTNKYATNAKSDFLNWALINAGTFDYAGDAWGYSYGASAEWYVGNWTLRGGIFDMSATPAGAAGNATSYGLDASFAQFQLIGEVESRYRLWGEPGKVKLTGFVIRGRMGNFREAIDLAQATGMNASDALAALRRYASRPGVSVNVEQQLSDSVGLFARVGWADGSVEPWDFADIDRTVSGGLSIAGAPWGRPDDTIGIAGAINGVSGAHRAYLAAGGLGILIGDGRLPDYGLEKIIEAYYSYALTPATRVSFDYQLVDNPGYNRDRGPVNLFAIRFRSQF